MAPEGESGSGQAGCLGPGVGDWLQERLHYEQRVRGVQGRCDVDVPQRPVIAKNVGKVLTVDALAQQHLTDLSLGGVSLKRYLAEEPAVALPATGRMDHSQQCVIYVDQRRRSLNGARELGEEPCSVVLCVLL